MGYEPLDYHYHKCECGHVWSHRTSQIKSEVRPHQCQKCGKKGHKGTSNLVKLQPSQLADDEVIRADDEYTISRNTNRARDNREI